MRVRTFRKMVYKNYFSQEYLELEQKKKELELRVENCLRDHDFEAAKTLSEQLEVSLLPQNLFPHTSFANSIPIFCASSGDMSCSLKLRYP